MKLEKYFWFALISNSRLQDRLSYKEKAVSGHPYLKFIQILAFVAKNGIPKIHSMVDKIFCQQADNQG